MHRCERSLLLVRCKVTAHPASGLIAINCWYACEHKAARLTGSDISFNNFVSSFFCIVSERYCDRETFSSELFYLIYRYYVLCGRLQMKQFRTYTIL